MKLEKQLNHWIPIGFHGSISYLPEADVETTINQAVKQATKGMPASMRPSVAEVKYIIDKLSNGNSILTFELIGQ